MFNDPLAYFITFTTYGTWLQGRETGSVDRSHNQFDMPILAPNRTIESRRRSQMRQFEYLLDQPRRQVVLATIIEVAAYRKWRLWAVHVRTNHVHVVVTANTKPEKVMNDFKIWCSRRLRETFNESADRDRWTQHGSTRYLFEEDKIIEKIDYVLNEQGEPMEWYRAEIE